MNLTENDFHRFLPRCPPAAMQQMLHADLPTLFHQVEEAETTENNASERN
jgi:hypothetical protein